MSMNILKALTLSHTVAENMVHVIYIVGLLGGCVCVCASKRLFVFKLLSLEEVCCGLEI